MKNKNRWLTDQIDKKFGVKTNKLVAMIDLNDPSQYGDHLINYAFNIAKGNAFFNNDPSRPFRTDKQKHDELMIALTLDLNANPEKANLIAIVEGKRPKNSNPHKPNRPTPHKHPLLL